jgi:RHS repeat-associated protein
VSVYDGSQVVWTETGTNREQMVSQGTTQAMLWAPGVDQLLAIQERLGGTGAVKQPVWTLTDHQGTVKDYLAKAPTAGAESGLLLTRRYSAFGTPVAAKVWSTLPIADFSDISGKSGFFYVGQEYDATTGLQYSRARYYDPVSSEFISQDPLGFAGGDTNLYRRAGNSPANATDPSGMILPAIALAVGAKLAIGYLATQATFALAETAIEVGATSWAGGEVSAGSAAETFGKNFAINVATGGIGTKAKLASRVGLYALRQGIEIGGDTAFDVGWRGQDFRSSLAINTAGSLIGEAAGRVAIAGARRALSRGSIDDVLRAGKNAVAPVNAVDGFVGPTIGRSGFRSAENLSHAIFTRYQRYADEAYSSVMKGIDKGRIRLDPSMAAETQIGYLVDRATRSRLRRWATKEFGSEGPDSIVRVNRWLREPGGSGYRIPDLAAPGHIFDLTIGLKNSATPQIADFFRFSGGSRVTIVRPSQLDAVDGIVGSYSIWR